MIFHLDIRCNYKITTGICHVSQQNVSRTKKKIRFYYLPVGKEIAKYLLVAFYVKCFGLSRNRLQIIVSYAEGRELLEVNLLHHN